MDTEFMNPELFEPSALDKKVFLTNYDGQKIMRADKTFVIDKDGLPYHVLAEDPIYAELTADYETNPDSWELEPEYVPEPISRKKEILAELAAIDRKYKTFRTLADATWGVEWALNRLEEAERLSIPLRNELAQCE